MNKTTFFILLTLFLSLFVFRSFPVIGQHFTSPSYIIDWGNFNMTSGKKTSANYSLTDTVGQIAPGLYTNTGFKVKSGFQYIYDNLTPFSFIIDDLNIELGTLIPGIGSTDTNIITISTPSGLGYQIMALENHPLNLLTGETIADTVCDNSLCTESASDTWTLSGTYGFGFNALGINTSGTVTGVGTSDIFTNATYFRQFADQTAGETAQIIMSENTPVKNHSARITYKANISAIQAAGNYENAVIFIAVPKY